MSSSVIRMAQELFLACVLVFLLSVSVRADDAASLYKAKCVACHAAGGGGTAVGKRLGAHDLRSAAVQKMTDAEFTEITAKGKNKMPGYEKTLKADEIKSLVTYMRSFAEKK